MIMVLGQLGRQIHSTGHKNFQFTKNIKRQSLPEIIKCSYAQIVEDLLPQYEYHYANLANYMSFRFLAQIDQIQKRNF